MSGCCAKCKVPFSWCGNPTCGCHEKAVRPANPQVYGSRDALRRLLAEAKGLGA